MVDAVPQLGRDLRLDQISAFYEIVDEAERGAVGPTEGLLRLQEIRDMPARHGVALSIVSSFAMTVGLCLVMQPTPSDIAIAAGVGLDDAPGRSRCSRQRTLTTP
jgi:hypothetical protein